MSEPTICTHGLKLIVVVAHHATWLRSQPRVIDFLVQQKAPDAVMKYYKVLIPSMMLATLSESLA